MQNSRLKQIFLWGFVFGNSALALLNRAILDVVIENHVHVPRWMHAATGLIVGGYNILIVYLIHKQRNTATRVNNRVVSALISLYLGLTVICLFLFGMFSPFEVAVFFLHRLMIHQL
jgi:hypothetical protein